MGLVGSSLPLNLGTLGLMCLPKYGKGCLGCELATHPSNVVASRGNYEYIRVNCIVFAIATIKIFQLLCKSIFNSHESKTT